MEVNEKKLGYIFVVFGVCMYAFSDAIMQYFMPRYGVNQVIFLRTVSRIIPFFVVALCRKTNPLRTSKIKENILRAGIATLSTYCFMHAYRYSALTDVIVVSYSMAIITLPLSMLILKEKFHAHNATAVILGFCGILLAFRPGIGVFQYGVMFALAGTVIAALNQVFIKKLSSTESELTLIFYHHIFLIVIAAILGFEGISSMCLSDIIALFFGGMVGAVSQYCIIHAFKLSTCSGLASAAYTMLVPTTIIDYFAYGKIPDMYIIAGSMLILTGSSIAYKMQSKFR